MFLRCLASILTTWRVRPHRSSDVKSPPMGTHILEDTLPATRLRTRGAVT